MPQKIDFLQLTSSSASNYQYNIVAIANSSATTGSSSINGQAELSGSYISKLKFDTSNSNPNHKLTLQFNNISFNNVDKTQYTLLEIDGSIRGLVAIKDTDFPPPQGLDKDGNVTDIADQFWIKQINLTKNETTHTFFIEIILQSTDSSKKYITQNPECRFQNIRGSGGNELKALILFPTRFDQGTTTPTFSISDVDFNDYYVKGNIPIFVVNGNSSNDAVLPINQENPIQKKGVIWIQQ